MGGLEGKGDEVLIGHSCEGVSSEGACLDSFANVTFVAAAANPSFLLTIGWLLLNSI